MHSVANLCSFLAVSTFFDFRLTIFPIFRECSIVFFKALFPVCDLLFSLDLFWLELVYFKGLRLFEFIFFRHVKVEFLISIPQVFKSSYLAFLDTLPHSYVWNLYKTFGESFLYFLILSYILFETSLICGFCLNYRIPSSYSLILMEMSWFCFFYLCFWS